MHFSIVFGAFFCIVCPDNLSLGPFITRGGPSFFGWVLFFGLLCLVFFVKE